MAQNEQQGQFKALLVLGAIWLMGAACDRIWFALDQSVPAWDQADYLTGSLNYWQALQNPQWFSGEWWTNLWQLSSKIPPFTYIATALVQHLFGTGSAQATLVLLLFSAILLASVYGLGIQLFNRQVGLWAAGIVMLLPGLYRYRLEFLLDYPLTAVVTLSFFCLTVWKVKGKRQKVKGKRQEEKSPHPPLSPSLLQWLWAAAFGLSLGVALMVKQTALLFLFLPILWVGAGTLRRREWGRLVHWVGGLCLSVLVFSPWYRTNWLLMLTAGKRATIDSAIAEGDPPLNTLDAWIYYWKILPYLVSWSLLLVPIVGLLIYWGRSVFRDRQRKQETDTKLYSVVVSDTGTRGHEDTGTAQNQFPRRVLRLIASWYESKIYSPQPPLSKGGRESVISGSSPFRWLAVFLVGGYLLSSLNVNKDARYVLPLLPALSLVLAYGLTCWKGRWGKSIRWGTISLAILLMFLNLFPLGGTGLTQLLSPRVQHHPYLGQKWPHPQVIEEITRTTPYLRSTLGVLPSTEEINQHNFNYYGALANFQVYGRQVGTREKQVEQDARSLPWFLTKTGDQGSVPEAQATIVQLVEQGSDFQLHKSWNLPDGSTLKLYHQRQPLVQVQPVVGAGLTQMSAFPRTNSINPPVQNSGVTIQLSRVIVPEKAPPGVPVPVTYEWTGSFEQLQAGIVLLTWQSVAGTPQQRWLHDHGIGMGELYLPNLKIDAETRRRGDAETESFSSFVVNASSGAANVQPASRFQVIERMSMLPPADMPAGTYTLEATYLNRKTGKAYPISVPPVTLNIDPTAIITAAPELDLITQLRSLAANLPQGPNALEPIFEQTGRINQYDPIQDYLVQAQLALDYRLQLEPQNRDWAYTLALSEVLQKNAKGAIAALKRVTQLDSQNPYAYAYLAFVHLYDWHPKDAENALKPALALNPNLPELQALSGVAALLQGNVFKASHVLRRYI